MEGLELKSFEIISSVGAARSCYIEAIELAYQGKYDEAKIKLEEGNQVFQSGHLSHASLVQQEASGNHVIMTLLLSHAEDQLMAAELCKIMANELIRLYEKVGKQ